MYDLGVSYTFHFHKKNTESSVIFSRNNVLILNEKENKEATAICFKIRILKKKNKELLQKVSSKIYEVILLCKKNETKMWFVNISEYHHWAMGLLYEGVQKIQQTNTNTLNSPQIITFHIFCFQN